MTYKRVEISICNYNLVKQSSNPKIFCYQVPYATRPNHLIIPLAFLGFGIGMVDSSMMPELGFLVDIRHSAVYGGVYAIGDIAFCLGFAVGKITFLKDYFFSKLYYVADFKLYFGKSMFLYE